MTNGKNLKAQVSLAVTAVLGVVALLCVAIMGVGLTGYTNMNRASGNLSRMTDHFVPLAQAVNDIKVDIIQVQQFLQDIAATRGLDGLDGGFKEAAVYAEKLTQDIAKAGEHAQALGLTEIAADLKVISDSFGPDRKSVV